MKVIRELQRLEPLSDRSAPSISALHRKLDATDRALAYLVDEGLAQVVAGE